MLACHILFGLIASDAPAQSDLLVSPRELLATDPFLFADWLDSNRPRPLTPDVRARILDSLSRQGRRTHFDASARRKLDGVRAFLRAAGQDSTFDILVVEAPQVRIGVYERSVILVTEPALRLLNVGELQAQIAHETGHLYFRSENERAGAVNNRRAKDLELLCDAIALVTLHRVRLDRSSLMAGVEKITRYNWNFRDVDESGYPTLGERQKYAREVTAWLDRAATGRPEK